MHNLVKLKDLCLRITDGSHYSPKENSQGIPMLSVKDMRENGFDYSDCKYVSLEDYELLKRNDCKPLLNDVLIAKDGSYLKHVFVIKEEIDQAILSSIGILRPDLKKVFPCYLKYYLQSESVKKTVAKKYVSGSALPRIILKNFGEIDILNRDLHTQKKIASVLSTLDDKIELNNEINAELEAMAKTLYDYWFVQFDFPNSEGKPYKSSSGEMVYDDVLKREIPKGWDVKNLLAISELLGGGTPSTTNQEFWNGSIPFFTPSDADDSIFAIKTIQNTTEKGVEKSSTKLFEKGTVFLTARGSVGKVMIASNSMAMNQSCYALKPNDGNFIFLYYSVCSAVGYLKAKSSGSIFNAIVSNDIRYTPVIIPDLNIRNSFNQLLSPYFERVLINLEQNQELASLQDWLLPMLMNGQVKVSEAYKEVEQKLAMVAEHDENYQLK